MTSEVQSTSICTQLNLNTQKHSRLKTEKVPAMPFYQMHPTRALEMLMPVVAIQLLLNGASEHTVHIRLLNRLKEILTNIILLSRAQEWYATYHLIHNYSRQFTTAQVLLVEEARTALAERFDEDYEIQQQRFMIIRQLGIGHVLLYREVNYFFNANLYLAFTARETVHDFHNDLSSLTWYFFPATFHGTYCYLAGISI